ncbi:MAG: zinc ribbon domain-containing protein [Methanomassiliicoccales archaeon]
MQQESTGPAFCVRCGEYLRPDTSFCPRCGAQTTSTSFSSYASSSAPNVQPFPSAQARTRRLTWAGILLLLSGLVGFAVASIVLLMSEEIIAEVQAIYQDQLPDMNPIILALAAFWSSAGALSIIGGICALKRRYYPLAIIGSVMALFTGGIFLFEGSIMGMVALILLIRSRPEFR